MHPSAVTSISSGKNYTYNPNGNMITAGPAGSVRNLTWDVENRLSSISISGATTTYHYDYTGMRVEKNAPSGTTIYPFKGYEINATSLVVTKFIRIGTETFASKRGTVKYFYHNDHLGGVNVITNSTGTRVQLTEYDPWGKVSRQTGENPPDPTHRFNGKELDPESGGLYYYGGRYYDPELARFVSPDPFVPQPSDPQSLNRYSYVNNNPVNLVDPDGHFFWAIAAIAKAIVAAVKAVAALVATIIKAAWAVLNTPIIGGTVGEAGGGFTVGHALTLAGGVRQAADLMQPAAQKSPGSSPGQSHDQPVNRPATQARTDYGSPSSAFDLRPGPNFEDGNGNPALDLLQLARWFPWRFFRTPPPPAGQPKPPGWSPEWQWKYPEHKTSPGEPRWFDPKGGEWRWHLPDKHHPQGHWDYNPWDKWNSQWQNVDPAGMPIPSVPSPNVPRYPIPELVPDPWA